MEHPAKNGELPLQTTRTTPVLRHAQAFGSEAQARRDGEQGRTIKAWESMITNLEKDRGRIASCPH